MIDTQASGDRLVGKYRGIVLKHLPHGRCKIYIPGVYSEEFLKDPDLLPSAEQATMMFAGTNEGNGVFTYPNLSSIVWCEFSNGDVNFPIYSLATLGGEDAFGQYDLIKTKDEPICTRHMITSGKTHIMWYESGKLSAIVEDPIRTQCSVDYDQFELEANNTSVDNKYSWSLSNDLRDKVHRKEISSIDCQIVLDNDADLHGELSVSTHWYDVINTNDEERQYKARGSNANDSYFLMNNDGLNELKTLSVYNVQENDSSAGKTVKTKNRVVHRIKTDNRGFYNQWSEVTKKLNSASPEALVKKDEEYSFNIDYKDDAYAAIDTYHQLTSNITENGITQNGITLHENSQVLGHDMWSLKDFNIVSADANLKTTYANISTISTDLLTDIDKGECRLHLLSSLNLTDINPQFGKQNVFVSKLTNDIDMINSGVIKIQTKVNDIRTTQNGVTDKKSEGTIVHDINGQYKRQTKYKYLTNSFGTTTETNNQNVQTVENKIDAKHSLIITSDKKANGTPVVDAKYSKIINLTTSTANIELIDNIAKKECVKNVDVKSGLLELRIKNKTSGMYCQILLDAEGKMTINTTSDINVTTPTQITVKADQQMTFITPQTTITGNVNIGGNTVIAGNLDVGGGETVGSDSVIGGKSFLGHMHTGNMGAPTSPPL